MFNSLKGKLKGFFKKTPEELKDVVQQEEEQIIKDEQPVENNKLTTPEVIPETDTPKLSRRERLKAEKVDREESKSLVGDSGKKIKDKNLEAILDELEIILLEADVAFSVAEEIKEGVRLNLTDKKYSRKYNLEEIVEMAVRDAVHEILKINEFDFDEWIQKQDKPSIVMFVGINGTGKTTAIAKLANRIQKNNMTVVLAACDTFRAGAIEQLSIHAERLGTKIVKHAQDADPAAVAYDAIEHARSKRRDVVLIDTAGRMQTNSNLINEMKKITRIAKPDLKIFVGDSLAGNDAIEQAKVFDSAIGIDAIILTKIDTDAKGGAALSIAHTIGKPIAFVCNGQEYDDIQKFNAKWMLDRLFD